MKTKILSLFAVSALVLSACSSHDDDTVTPVNGSAEIKVGSSLKGTVTPNTYAFDATWEASDAIGLYVIKDGGSLGTAADILFANSEYEYNASPSWTPTTGYKAFQYTSGPKPLYPVDNSKIQLAAYYPYNSAWSSTTAAQTLSVVTQTTQKNIDLLYAQTTTGNHQKSLATTPIDLGFTHKLSKLIIKVVHGDDVTAAEAAGVTVALKKFVTDGTFVISTGTVTAGTTTTTDIVPASMTPVAGMDAQFEAILMPQALTAGTEKVEFTIGSDVFTWDLTAPTSGTALTALAAGTKYEYTVKVNRKGLLVDGKITDWTTGTSGAGNAE